MKFKKAFVDADMLLFPAAKALMKEINWGNFHTNYSDFEAVKETFLDKVDNVLKKIGSPSHVLVFTHKENWRKWENPNYKGHREAKPLCIYRTIEWCLNNDDIEAVCFEGLEADDVLGIMSGKYGDDTVIVSGDKDMNTIPGWLFDFNRMTSPTKFSKAEADFHFYKQALMGDPTDGFAGCKKMGPKTAPKLVAQFFDEEAQTFDEQAAWEEIVAAYEKQGQPLEEAIMNARMARICRKGDWNFKKGEMVWMPPKIK